MSKQRLLQQVLDGTDAEFLFQQARNGVVKLRIGQLWTVPKMQGSTALLLDYDNCRAVNICNIRKRLSKAGVQVVRILVHRSPSGAGWHAVVYIAGRWSKWQRVALEGICESDPERSAQNFKRALLKHSRWGDKWAVLFS